VVEHWDQHHKAGDDQAGKRIGAALGVLDIGRRAGVHICNRYDRLEMKRRRRFRTRVFRVVRMKEI
jgi:hypothetical protein